MATMKMDFLGNKVTPIVFEDPLKVSPDQCRGMKVFKLCGENKMSCNKNTCKSKHPNLDVVLQPYVSSHSFCVDVS